MLYFQAYLQKIFTCCTSLTFTLCQMRKFLRSSQLFEVEIKIVTIHRQAKSCHLVILVLFSK